MRLKLIALSFVFCIAIGLADLRPASALSCARSGTEYDEFKASSLVFAGTVLNDDPRGEAVRFDVTRLWKGNEAVAREGIRVGNAWIVTKPGETYLIFANLRDDRWTANVCGYSEFVPADWDPREMDATFASAGIDTHDGPSQPIAWLSAAAVLALIGIALSAKHRDRRNRRQL